MKIIELKRNKTYENDFPDIKSLKSFEGGSIYTAEKDEKYYLILDESSMVAILDEEVLPDCLVKIIEFDSIIERLDYIKSRRWN